MKHNQLKKKLPYFVLLPLIVIAIIFSFLLLKGDKDSKAEPADATIVLGKEGFQPEKITIKKGETVEFKTTRETYFWPASNLHPTHELYAEFDPQEPIEPAESWNFTFEETGQWQYHDHLAPYYTGTITVVE